MVDQIRNNMIILSKKYARLDHENFNQVYQEHFNECVPYQQAGFRSLLDMFNRGQVAKGAFGYYKDTNGEPYNFVLTSIQYSEEDAQSPILLQSSSLLEQQRHEGAGVPHLPGSELKLMSIHGVTYLPQQYSIYIEEHKRLTKNNLRQRVLVCAKYNRIPYMPQSNHLVNVTTANDVTSFSARLKGDFYSSWFLELQDHLKTFYYTTKNKQKYSIYNYPGFLKQGQACVVTLNGNIYCRAAILKMENYEESSEIQCVLVDFGVVHSISKARIFIIDQVFMQPPMQAIEMRLYGLSPPSGHRQFCPEAVKLIMSNISAKSVDDQYSTECQIVRFSPQSLAVDLRHKGSPLTVAESLLKAQFAVKNEVNEQQSPNVQSLQFFPPCKVYADMMCETDRNSAPYSTRSLSNRQPLPSFASTNPAVQANQPLSYTPSLLPPSTNNLSVVQSDRPRRDSLEGWED